MVERGPGFAKAIRRELPNGADALLDTAALGEESFGAIRDGGIYIPVRGWGDKPAERGIKTKPMIRNWPSGWNEIILPPPPA